MSKQGVKTTPGVDPKKLTSFSGLAMLHSLQVSGELFTLTYGALVAQLLKDYENADAVNRQLDKIGYNIGMRIIDDFLSKSPTVGRCNDFREVAEVLAKQGFKLYLGVTPTISNWNASGDEFSLIMDTNPLTEFVELPSNADHMKNLRYSQVLCGAIRGAMEMVHLETQAAFAQDQLRGDATTEIRVRFIRKLQETALSGDD